MMNRCHGAFQKRYAAAVILMLFGPFGCRVQTQPSTTTSPPRPAAASKLESTTEGIDPMLAGTWRTTIRAAGNKVCFITRTIDNAGNYTEWVKGPDPFAAGNKELDHVERGSIVASNGDWCLYRSYGPMSPGRYRFVSDDIVLTPSDNPHLLLPLAWTRLQEPGSAVSADAPLTQSLSVTGSTHKEGPVDPRVIGSWQVTNARDLDHFAVVVRTIHPDGTMVTRTLQVPGASTERSSSADFWHGIWQSSPQERPQFSRQYTFHDPNTLLVQQNNGLLEVWMRTASPITKVLPLSRPTDRWKDAAVLVQRIEDKRRLKEYRAAADLVQQLSRFTVAEFGQNSWPYVEEQAYADKIFNEAGNTALEQGSVAQVNSALNQLIQNTMTPLAPLHAQAEQLKSQGKLSEALHLSIEETELWQRLGTVGQSGYGDSLKLEAELCRLTGNDLAASALYRQSEINAGSMQVRRFGQVVEATDQSSPRELDARGLLYLRLGEYAAAEDCFLRELELYGGSVQPWENPSGPDVAVCYGHLGQVAQCFGDTAFSLKAFEVARQMGKHSLGSRVGDYVGILNGYGKLLIEQGRYDEAGQLIKEAKECASAYPQDLDREIAGTIENEAMIAASQGSPDRAKALSHNAADLRKKSEPFGEVEELEGMLNEAEVAYLIGDVDRAARLSLQATKVMSQRMSRIAAVEPDYRQLNMYSDVGNEELQVRTRSTMPTASGAVAPNGNRTGLDLYLSAALDARMPASDAYAPVLAWKGAVTLRQMQMRAARSAGKLMPLQDAPDVDKLPSTKNLQFIPGELPTWTRIDDPFEMIHFRWTWSKPKTIPFLLELIRSDSFDLSNLVAGDPRNDAAARKIANDAVRISHDERELDGLQAQLGQATFELIGKNERRSPQDSASMLPEKSAFIDFVQYTGFSAPPDHRGGLRKEPRMAAFVLTRDRPVVRVELGSSQAISQKVKLWRTVYGNVDKSRSAGIELRRMIWGPLGSSVGASKLVFISPDGPISEFPLGALPGDDANKYLIEERDIAIEPSLQYLANTLESQPLQGELAMFALGVDPDVKAGNRQREAEAQQVCDLFRQKWPGARVDSCKGSEAKFGAVVRKVNGCRFLHVASDGFVDPPPPLIPFEFLSGVQRQALDDYANSADAIHQSPALRSKILLAPPLAPRNAGSVLTAFQAAQFDLGQTDLVWLAACNTASGANATSEGLLGLRRAFQIAGARSVVSSLWRADDQCTEVLTQLFYDYLWNLQANGNGRPTGAPMWNWGKAEALCAAQRELIRHGAKYGIVRGDQTVLPPKYWAEFELSGDWR